MSKIETKVSIIVPVYNAARYIGDCMRSLLEQDMKEMEIICADDGSTDDSMKIVESFKRSDTRVETYYCKHLGPGAARNLGLAQSSGKYILFVDSDDMLSKGAIGTLLSRVKDMETDILYFSGDTIYETPELEESYSNFKGAYKRETETTEIMTGPSLLALMHDAKDYKPSCVMQMYSREFIERYGLRFNEDIIHEDALFSFSAILRARRAAVTRETLYIRRVRKGSIMTTSSSFDNVYGYYVVMKEMLSIMKDVECARKLSEDEYFAALKTIRRMTRRSAKMYAEVGEDNVENHLSEINLFDRTFMNLTIRPEWRYRTLREKNMALKEKNLALKEKLSAQRKTIAALKKDRTELSRIKSSISYRLGRALTYIPRKIKGILQGR